MLNQQACCLDQSAESQSQRLEGVADVNDPASAGCCATCPTAQALLCIPDRSDHHRRARRCCRLSDVRPAEPVRRVAPTKDQMVGGFSSKSEVALNLSTDGQHLIFMGYLGPIDALDISNSNTPEHPLCRGQRQQRWGSPTEWGQCRRGCANPYRRNEGAGRAGPRFAAPVASFNIT